MPRSNSSFVHIHCHSEYSRFDGLNKMGEWVLYARKMGFKALALTDHGNIGGWGRFYTECKRKKDKKEQEIPYDPIKPIFGQEFYLSRNRFARGKEQQPDGRKGNRHILLLAKNQTGYENLCRLSQKGFVDGQAFGDPRIDIDLLANHSKGLICSSACLSSVINNNLLMGRYEQAKTIASYFKDIFGEDFFLEAMYHGIEAEGVIIPLIIKLGKELNIPVVASNDCHYCQKEQARSQELLMAMSTSRCLKDPKRYSFPYDEFYLKSAEEMAMIFGSHPELLDNTLALTERIDDFFKPGLMRLPNFNVQLARAEQEAYSLGVNFAESEQGKKFHEEIMLRDTGASVGEIKSSEQAFNDAYKFLGELAEKGMKKLGWDKSDEHIKQLKLEMDDVKVAWDSNKMDFATYFLIVWQYINYAKQKKIITGCGRGSGYASVLLRTLGITYGPDPLKYGLLWERFLAFDDRYFVQDSDWGFDEPEEVEVSVDAKIDATDDIEDEREVEEDEGGVDRY